MVKNISNPLTGEVGLKTYEKNATWDTCFGKIASNYEECRAECTGIYLCLETFSFKTAVFTRPILMTKCQNLTFSFLTESDETSLTNTSLSFLV